MEHSLPNHSTRNTSLLYKAYPCSYIISHPTTVLDEPECRTDSDCPYTKACINEVCADPCLVEDPCGKEALCRTQQHRPICYCPEGWAGNPEIECFKREYHHSLMCIGGYFGLFFRFWDILLMWCQCCQLRYSLWRCMCLKRPLTSLPASANLLLDIYLTPAAFT